MAQIVLNKDGGFIECQESSVELTGAGYANFDIIDIPDLTKEETESVILAKLPETAMAYKATESWSLTLPEKKAVWNNNGEWCEIVEKGFPKLTVELSKENIETLNDEKAIKQDKIDILSSICSDKISSNVLNLTAVADLNTSEVIK